MEMEALVFAGLTHKARIFFIFFPFFIFFIFISPTRQESEQLLSVSLSWTGFKEIRWIFFRTGFKNMF